MKRKLILKGILACALVFGLGVVLAGCGLSVAEIIVTNSSQYPSDDPVTVYVYMQGRSDPLATQSCARGASVTFSQDSGDYQIRVVGSGASAYFPQDGSHIKMTGTFKLNYNGATVTRTN